MSGLQRNIKYLSLLQFRYMVRGVLFGTAYGLFFGFMTADDKVLVMRRIFQYDKIILYMLMMTLQLRYVSRVSGFVCSMGCTRKNLVRGQHIMNLEVLAEILPVLFAAKLIMGLGRQDVREVLLEMASIILFMAIGMFFGLLKENGGKWIIFVIAMVIGVSCAGYFVGSMNAKDADMTNMFTIPNAFGFLAATVLLYAILSCFVAKKYKKLEVIV
ncbi:MAG: hypothetical protein E7294_02625 [Lachnospiraceae bacterium]|nr:hypothetical protein [Lachnospiraceae bacterium]